MADASRVSVSTWQRFRIRRWVHQELLRADPSLRSRKPGGAPVRLLASDFDLTLANSEAGFPLLDREGRALRYPAAHPLAGQEVVLGHGPERDPARDLARLKEAWGPDLFPALHAPGVRIDHSVLLQRDAIAGSQPIPAQVDAMRESAARSTGARNIIITGRPDCAAVRDGTRGFARAQGLPPVAVFAVGRGGALERLAPGLDYGVRKALVLDAILSIYRSRGPGVGELHFADNDAAYQEPVMRLLTRWHPDVDMYFWGMLHKGRDAGGRDVFKHYPLARFNLGPGETVRELRHPLGRQVLEDLPARLAAYEGRQRPFTATSA